MVVVRQIVYCKQNFLFESQCFQLFSICLGDSAAVALGCAIKLYDLGTKGIFSHVLIELGEALELSFSAVVNTQDLHGNSISKILLVDFRV